VDVDLWDHKLAAERRVLQEIFAEVVDKNARVSDHGRVLDPSGRVLKDYSDGGLPAFLEFDAPAAAAYFTLDVNGQQVKQPLSDRATAPVEAAAPAAPPTPPPAPPAKPVSPLFAQPVAAPPPPKVAPSAPPPIPPLPVAPAASPVASAKPEKPAAEDDDEALWRGIDLEFDKTSEASEGAADVNLEEQKDEK
jgi:hypothetical protein